MDYEFELLAKEYYRKKNYLHGMIDRLGMGEIEELYQLVKRLYFPDRF